MRRLLDGEVTEEAAGGEAANVPRGAAGHFLLHFFAAVDRLLRYTRRIAPAPPAADGADALRGRYPFLAGYEAEVRAFQRAAMADGEALAWWEHCIIDWEARDGG